MRERQQLPASGLGGTHDMPVLNGSFPAPRRAAAAAKCKKTVRKVKLLQGGTLQGLLQDGGKYQEKAYVIEVLAEVGKTEAEKIKLSIQVQINDADECGSDKGYNKCGAGMFCTNTKGSYTCSCAEGGKEKEGYEISKTFDQTKDAFTAWDSPERAQVNSEKAALTCKRKNFCMDPALNKCDLKTTRCINSEKDLENGAYKAPGYTCEYLEIMAIGPPKPPRPWPPHWVGGHWALMRTLAKCCVRDGPKLTSKKCPAAEHSAGCDNRLDCEAIDAATLADPKKIRALVFGPKGVMPGGTPKAFMAAPDSICFNNYKCKPGFEYKDGACVDVDECKMACTTIFDEASSESPQAWLKKDIDGFKKSGKEYGEGWTVSGAGCHDCDKYAGCQNTAGSFECKCGFALGASGALELKDKDFKPNENFAGHTAKGCKDETLPKVVPMCCPADAQKPADAIGAGIAAAQQSCKVEKVECITLTTDAKNVPCCGDKSPTGESCSKFNLIRVRTLARRKRTPIPC